MIAHLRYLKYVLVHKYWVFKACMRLPVSLRQALMHDMSKFRPSEWLPYKRHFYNDYPDMTPEKALIRGYHGPLKCDTKAAFDNAWNHHQKRNPHHWQYWVLVRDTGEVECMPMPAKYVFEMLADWFGAGMAVNGYADVEAWYEGNRDRIQLHPYTRSFLEEVMTWPQVQDLFGSHPTPNL